MARITGRPPFAPFAYVITSNAAHAAAAYRGDERFAAPQRGAWLVLNDSRALRLLAWVLFGQALPVARGRELTRSLFESGHMRGETLTIIGGDTAMTAHLRRRYSPTAVAQHIPPADFFTCPREIEACIAFVRAHPARYVFIVVGAPYSEMLAERIARERRATGVGLCVGAALSVLTGRPRRAPDRTHKGHLGWFYRVARNPMRYARRAFIGSVPIAWIALRERVAVGLASWPR